MVSLLLPLIYLCFISLGLPDGLLGAAWPVMSPDYGVPVSYMGFLSVTIQLGTVVSSLISHRMIRRFGTGNVMVASVAMTALAMLGFSAAPGFWALWLWAIPYGLGGGAVDAALNNFVALHYPSRHMSWLHCMWGVGAAAGPSAMSIVLTRGMGWAPAYRLTAAAQGALAVMLLFSIPLWRKIRRQDGKKAASQKPPVTLRQAFSVKGAQHLMLMFLAFCGLEQTSGLWSASYLVLHVGITEEKAAFFAGIFFAAITAGRLLSGFLTYQVGDTDMIWGGIVTLAVGLAVMTFSRDVAGSVAGLILVGLGASPVFPCVLHAAPEYFGRENSQVIIGMLMAGGYLGGCFLPPLFGVLARWYSPGLLPIFLGILTGTMLVLFNRLQFLLTNPWISDD